MKNYQNVLFFVDRQIAYFDEYAKYLNSYIFTTIHICENASFKYNFVIPFSGSSARR